MPLVQAHLTANQWDKLGERGAKAIQDKRKRLIFLGRILEETSPEEERDFLAKMPGPVRLLWKVIGRRQYDAYTRRTPRRASQGPGPCLAGLTRRRGGSNS